MHRYFLLILRHQCKLRLDLVTFRDVSNFIDFSQSISTTLPTYLSVKNICARFITVSVKKLLHYRAGGLLQYRAVLLHYRAVITVSGVFITLSGSYYSIGRLLHYRLVQECYYTSMKLYQHMKYSYRRKQIVMRPYGAN